MPLKGKDQFQVFAFSTVIQKAIIPDLLKTGREHMHQITADELDVFQSDHPARFTGSFPLAEKVTCCSSAERIRLLEMAILWVYLPRYSTALPNPWKVSFM